MVSPIAFAAAIAALGFTAEPLPRPLTDWRIVIHARFAVLAFATHAIAAVVSIHNGIQDHALRTHRWSRWFSGAMPLTQVEHLLFQWIGAGFLLLTLMLVTGVIFIEDLLAQHLARKTSAGAWVVFGILLLGCLYWGWRGHRAIRIVCSMVC